MSKKVLIQTFGCQMNGYDSDKIADVLNTAQGDASSDKVDNVDEAASLHWHHFDDLTSYSSVSILKVLIYSCRIGRYS